MRTGAHSLVETAVAAGVEVCFAKLDLFRFERLVAEAEQASSKGRRGSCGMLLPFGAGRRSRISPASRSPSRRSAGWKRSVSRLSSSA